jgi:hypothetical protein
MPPLPGNGDAGLDDRERLLGSVRDRLSLMLGDQRHDADSEVVGVRHVYGDEVNACLL